MVCQTNAPDFPAGPLHTPLRAASRDQHLPPDGVLVWRHIANDTVAVFVVAPQDKVIDPRSSRLDAFEWLARLSRHILERAEQNLGARIVLIHRGPTEGRHDPQFLQGGQHRRTLHEPAIIGMEHHLILVNAFR